MASSAAAQVTRGSQLSFIGSANATDIGSAGVVLDFTGPVRVAAAGNTGSFTSLNRPNGAGLMASIQSITVGNGPQAIASFLVLGGYQFSVQSLPSGAYGQDDCYVYPEPGQHCTPYQFPSYALSPFYLTNDYSGDPDAPINGIAAYDLVGTVVGTDGIASYFRGTISSTFQGLSYQEALYGLEQYGLADVPFTGTFTVGDPVVTATPEPGTYALVATGVLALAAVRRRRRR